MKARGVLLSVIVIVSVLVGSTILAVATHCPTPGRPANPAPAPRPQAPSGVVSDCLAKIYRDFNLKEESVQTIRLEKGKSYWVAASGCPRMGNIRLSIRDKNGNTLKQDVGYSPSFCFIPANSGEYRLTVRADSLMGTNTVGTIDACTSASQCSR